MRILSFGPLEEYRPLVDEYEDLDDSLFSLLQDMDDKWRIPVRELVIAMDIPEDDIPDFLRVSTYGHGQKINVYYSGEAETSTGEDEWDIYLDISDAEEDAMEKYSEDFDASDYINEAETGELEYFVSERDLWNTLNPIIRERAEEMVREDPDEYQNFLSEPHKEDTEYSDEEISEMEDGYIQMEKDSYATAYECAQEYLGDFYKSTLINLVDKDDFKESWLEGYDLERYQIEEILDTFDGDVEEWPCGALAYGKE